MGYIGPLCIYAYFVVSTVINKFIMSSISHLVVKQERLEGDFRFSLVAITICSVNALQSPLPLSLHSSSSPPLSLTPLPCLLFPPPSPYLPLFLDTLSSSSSPPISFNIHFSIFSSSSSSPLSLSISLPSL